jgi:hypothetical protein
MNVSNFLNNHDHAFVMSEYNVSQDDEQSVSDESDFVRPNRWTEAPSTWQSITKQERGIAASLDESRNRDLSIHLYNAHALKKRGKDLEKKAACGIKVASPLS